MENAKCKKWKNGKWQRKKMEIWKNANKKMEIWKMENGKKIVHVKTIKI